MLPIYQTDSKDLSLLQTNWASQLNPLLSQPLASSLFLKNVSLVSGVNNINHKLGRKLQGWVVTRMQDVHVNLYDLQNSNQMTDKILILNSSGAGVVDLLVF